MREKRNNCPKIGNMARRSFGPPSGTRVGSDQPATLNNMKVTTCIADTSNTMVGDVIRTVIMEPPYLPVPIVLEAGDYYDNKEPVICTFKDIFPGYDENNVFDAQLSKIKCFIDNIWDMKEYFVGDERYVFPLHIAIVKKVNTEEGTAEIIEFRVSSGGNIELPSKNFISAGPDGDMVAIKEPETRCTSRSNGPPMSAQ